MRIISDVKLDFEDVLLVPKRSTITSRADVQLERKFTFKNGDSWTIIPILSANMLSVTNNAVAEIMNNNKMSAVHPKGALKPGVYGIPTYGLADEIPDFTRRVICLDVANGYIEKFVDKIKRTREKFSDVLIAGNVVTPEMTEALILAGADIVKVGIGSGGACSTRIKTGVGYPQLSAVIECADAAHGVKGHVMSDGGCKTPGDVVKAFAAGADFVMLGSMLAGHDENGRRHFGMASKRAASLFAGGLKHYRAEEGFEVKLPARGPLDGTLQEIVGGLRSACAYLGATRIKDLTKCATFIKVNRQANTSLWEHRV